MRERSPAAPGGRAAWVAPLAALGAGRCRREAGGGRGETAFSCHGEGLGERVGAQARGDRLRIGCRAGRCELGSGIAILNAALRESWANDRLERSGVCAYRFAWWPSDEGRCVHVGGRS